MVRFPEQPPKPSKANNNTHANADESSQAAQSTSISWQWQSLANPTRFLQLAGKIEPWLFYLCPVLFGMGLYMGLVTSPADYQQGDSVRIMYIHVPSAYLALMAYGIMAVSSIFYVIFRHNFADIAAKAAAPIGALFCLMALITGSIWGKPTWGTWWVWDARLTSMLVQFFLYCGYLALAYSFEKPGQSAMPCALLAIFGSLNIPIIKFSVAWWNTLHQPASLFRADGPSLAPAMLYPLLTMLAAFTVLFLLVWHYSIRLQITEAKLKQLRYRLATSNSRQVNYAE